MPQNNILPPAPPHHHPLHTHAHTVCLNPAVQSKCTTPLLPLIVVAYFAPAHACLTLYSALATPTPPHIPQSYTFTYTKSRAADSVTTATGGRLASKAPIFIVPQSPPLMQWGRKRYSQSRVKMRPSGPQGFGSPSRSLVTSTVASVGSQQERSLGQDLLPSASHCIRCVCVVCLMPSC